MTRAAVFACLALVLSSSPARAQQMVAGERLTIAQESRLSGDVGHPDYVSQLTRWKITPDGAADFRYLFTDELHAKSFIADLEQALAGGQIISKSVAVLASNFSVPAAGAAATITVRDLPSAENMAVFESGDTIRLRTFSRASGSLTIADAYGVVTAYSDQTGGVQTWTFTRNTSANGGSMTAGTVIQADALVLDYGVSGNGFHEVNAIDGLYGINSPYSQIVTWTTAPIAGNLVVRSRLGNLRGITGVANEFGLIAGTYAASNGQYFRASTEAFELHGINLTIWDGATQVIKLDRTAPSLAIGSPVPTAYGTGTGIWMGKDAGIYKFRVGNPSGNRFTWDGSTATFVGDGGGVTNINGGNIQTDTITATQIAANAITTSELNADSVTSAKIAANTIVAADIAASTITADRMSVSTLSAITANLGTVTAGTITGVTINAGTGAITIDNDGILINTGANPYNRINWNNGAFIRQDRWQSQGDIVLLAGGQSGELLTWSSAKELVNSEGKLGHSAARWNVLYLSETLNWSSPPTTDANDYPMVYSTGNTQVYRKTDGFDGTCNSPTTITIERGIVTGCS